MLSSTIALELTVAHLLTGLDPKAARDLLRGGEFGGLRDCIR